jgi:hypothetical protein
MSIEKLRYSLGAEPPHPQIPGYATSDQKNLIFVEKMLYFEPNYWLLLLDNDVNQYHEERLLNLIVRYLFEQILIKL